MRGQAASFCGRGDQEGWLCRFALYDGEFGVVFSLELLNPLDQGLFEFEQAREIRIQIGGVVDVIDDGGESVAKKDGGDTPHDCKPLTTGVAAAWIEAQ